MNEDELREEIESHLRMRAQHSGISETSARKRFGNAARVQEEMRSMHVSVFVDQIRQDLRYALRRAMRQPAFTFAAIATIALGVGASSAVFSVVDRILFRPLPFPHEEQLVWLGMTAPIAIDEVLLGADYFDWKEHQQVFSNFTASVGSGQCDITETGEPVELNCLRIASDYLATFGYSPLRGRTFTAEEDRAGGPKAILISHALWQGRFGASEDILRKTIELNGAPTRIAGVLPANFEVPNLARVDIAQPLALDEARERARKGMMIVRAWARLKPGVTLDRARAAMAPLFERSLKFVPKAFAKEVKFELFSFRERQARDSRATSLALLGAVLCVLLIACANVMNLFLARANASAREYSIREAIGASRARLVRQSLTESLLICFSGGVLGLAGGFLFLRLAVLYAPPGIPRLLEATLDGRVAAFALLLAAAAGLVSGFRIQEPSRGWLRPALVTLQIALAGSLLYAACLLGESLWKMQNVPLGIATNHLVSTRVRFMEKQAGVRDAMWKALDQRVAGLPGVVNYAFSDSLPPLGRTMMMIYSRISIDGKPEDLRGGTGGMVCARTVSPGYFQALRIPVRKGRTFTVNERDAIVLSARLAQRLFGTLDVVDRKVQPGTGEGWRNVVGVVADVNNNGIETGDPEYYLPLAREEGPNGLFLTLSTSGDPKLLADLTRAEIHAVDPHAPVSFETMEQRSAKLTERPRFNAVILTCFAIAGLLIGAIGVYGVVSFLILQRSKEIAVRMAIGATAAQIRRLILGASLRWTAAGVIAGAMLMAAILPLFRSLLYETPPARPWLMLATLTTLAVAVFLASLAPANAAARTDPMRTLKQD
jgi:hypothetical protein